MLSITVNEPLLKVGCTLGEGPLYDGRTSELHFVDIVEKKVFHLNTETLNLEVEEFQEAVTCLALRRNHPGLACATASGFALMLGQSRLQYLSQPLSPEHLTHIRFNDGACDREGRFFAGTICYKDDTTDIPGQLWRFSHEDGSCVIVDKGPFTDSNGLGWSPDGRILYFTDSLVNIIYAYDYDNGELSNRRIFADALALGLQEKTYADGLCVDDEGGVWSARWGGGRVVRFTKDGQLDAEIVFSSALIVTACCFGGPNNDQMYVTTADCGAMGGDVLRQEHYPDSGHLFVVNLAGKFRGAQWRFPFAG